MQSGPKSVFTAPEQPAIRTTPSLTDLEQQILDYMVLYLRTHTYQPSIREIGYHFGIRSTKTVSELLQSLAEKGVVERDPSRSRGIRILGLDLNAQTVSLPCFRDLKEAGDGRRGEDSARRVSLDRQLLNGNGGFMVRAPGGRLAPAGIDEGDILVVQPVRLEELADGEVVVAAVGDVMDYYQLEKHGSRFALLTLGGDRTRAGAAGTGQTVIVGRVSALFRKVGPLPLTVPATAH
ncbi:MAG: hypothetical protein OXK74_07110 [Gemmatimonadota bacterium]|nr:hypothetical protein [Gemmatimonadota bacterium]